VLPVIDQPERRRRLERAVQSLRNGLHADHPRVLQASALLQQLQS
jgi:hypothetical protein